ncbi:hypothetical protein BU23DRAFT_505835 [Bimuria novae-zelandiae CBS 107.79]|uniref:Uncharacterized protein n=1 Tax=Bimuria novae-zelandiae CBS 107.79 TaxID=1447943 RepID=A0A6A5V9I0_9PLEO|nr:hypothetical protein BU23DRAFT_505835 [Bimuria novae-zelandiae CBS 107.79]
MLPIPRTTSFEAQISRSSTFDAKQRVQQLCNHLERSVTMQREALQELVSAHDAPQTSKPEEKKETPKTEEVPVVTCKFCKRPSQCPTCRAPVGPPVVKKDSTNLDVPVPDIYAQLPPPLHPSTSAAQHPLFVHAVPPTPPLYRKFSVFAAGSIEMGAAIQWQPLLANHLCTLPITLCNPRRGSWDTSISSSQKDKNFRAQVEWELAALEHVDVIAFFFDHATMSPVSLCELGLWARSGKVVLCCETDLYWKGGNVALVCERYGIPRVERFEELVELVKAKLRTKGLIVDKKGEVTENEGERDPAVSMTLEEAERFCEERVRERKWTGKEKEKKEDEQDGEVEASKDEPVVEATIEQGK